MSRESFPAPALQGHAMRKNLRRAVWSGRSGFYPVGWRTAACQRSSASTNSAVRTGLVT
jgi:hypothetical protein